MKVRKYIWIILGAVSLIFNGLFGIFPSFYDSFYFRGVFQGIRVIYDYTLGWVPFPMVYVLFFIVVQLIYQFLKFKEFRKSKTILGKVWSVVLPILSLLGAIVFFFYFLWGFNYQQKKLNDQLEFPKVVADTTVLYNEVLFFTKKLKLLRNQISEDSTALDFSYLPEDYEVDIRAQLEATFSEWGFPIYGRVRVRELYPKGILLRISTAGVYIPFVFEGHIDAGLHPIQYPFTMAHEMSHGYGIADEGTCNFTGFLACMRSDLPFIQYSASISLWRYMANNLRKGSPKLYRKLMKGISPNVRRDLIAVMDEMDKYPDLFPEVRDAVYDSYLKSHGVDGGLSSYSTVVSLVMAWKKSGYNSQLAKDIYSNQEGEANERDAVDSLEH